MSVSLNVITPQGLEPLQFPTKFRSPSPKGLMIAFRLLEEGLSEAEEGRLRRLISEAEGTDPVEARKASSRKVTR